MARGRGSALLATGAGEGAREEVRYLKEAEGWGSARTRVGGRAEVPAGGRGLSGRGVRVRLRGGTWR